jgi:hypothetical protein
MTHHFETFDEARDRRRKKRAVLRRGDRTNQLLARKLRRCRKGRRCNSAACDVCMRRHRKELYRKLNRVFKQHPQWTRASIITNNLTAGYGQLNRVNLLAVARRLRKRIERSRIRRYIVMAGIDFSLNLEANKIQHWQLHVYLVVNAKLTSKLKKSIRATFPPEPTAKRPYTFAPVKDPAEVLTYLYKSIFHRRSGYQRDGNHQVRNLPLKGNDLRELLPVLDRHRLGDRLILRGVRRNGSRMQVTMVGKRQAAKS